MHVIDFVITINYKVLRCPRFADKKTGALVFDPNESNPYCLLPGEFAVFLYFNIADTSKLPGSFSVWKIIADAEVNNYQTGESVLECGEDIFNEYIKELILATAASVFGWEIVPEETIKTILLKISSDEGLVGTKYTNQEMLGIIIEEFSKG